MNPKRKRVTKNISFKILTAVVFLQVILISWLLIQLNPTVKNALVLATQVKKESFTELYFENYQETSENIPPLEPYTFSFTVHNLENQDMSYPYEVFIDSNGKKQILIKDTVFVKNSEFKTISVTFSVPPVVGRFAVTVMLLNKNQQLNFWLQGS